MVALDPLSPIISGNVTNCDSDIFLWATVAGLYLCRCSNCVDLASKTFSILFISLFRPPCVCVWEGERMLGVYDRCSHPSCNKLCLFVFYFLSCQSFYLINIRLSIYFVSIHPLLTLSSLVILSHKHAIVNPTVIRHWMTHNATHLSSWGRLPCLVCG